MYSDWPKLDRSTRMVMFIFSNLAFLSVLVAMSKPWKNLDASMPPLRLLTACNLVSVFSHLGISIGSQAIIFSLVRQQPWWTPFEPSEDRLDSAGSYETTSLFYFSCFQYIFVCWALAKGPPFRERVYGNGRLIILLFLTHY